MSEYYDFTKKPEPDVPGLLEDVSWAGQYVGAVPDKIDGRSNWRNDREKLQANKYDFKSTHYPENVDGDDGMGHYILFNINITNDSYYTKDFHVLNDTFSSKDSGNFSREGLSEEDVQKLLKKGQDLIGKATSALTGGFKIGDKIVKAVGGYTKKSVEKLTKTYGKFNLTKNTKRIQESIVLYMPETLETKYSTNWTEKSFDSKLIDMASTLRSNMEGDSARARDAAIDVGFGSIESGAAIIDALQAITPGYELHAKDFLTIAGRRARNPHIEFMFEGVNNREFTFSFTFMPKNSHEVNLVDNIIGSFKFHAAPEILGNSKTGAYYRYPSTFDIMFVANQKENKRINKISTCVLKNIDIVYSDESGTWTTFKPDSKGSMPTTTKLTLTFGETEQITKERIVEGF